MILRYSAMIGRSIAIASVAFLLGILTSVSGGSVANAQETVVYAGWGGVIQAAQRKIIFDQFEKETKIKVADVPGVELAKIRAMVESKNVQWDVVQPNEQWVALGEKEGMWEELDYKVIDKSGVPDALVRKYGIGWGTFGIVLAYNSKTFPAGKEPKSWADFWDTDKFPGRRGYYDQAKYMLEFALIADGVPLDKVYPIDVDRAFKSLDKIKSKIHVWTKQPAGVPVLLASGEIASSPGTSSRFVLLKKSDNAPLEIVWKGGIMQTDYLAVPKGAKNKANAMKLIAFMTKAEMQAELAKAVLVGPANTKAFALLADAEKEQLPSYHAQKGEMLILDPAWWVANLSKMDEKWNEWKLK